MIKLLIILSVVFTSTFSHARLVRIIHTNDLHSYFTGYYSGLGGYAKVRTKIKEIRADSAASGVEVIHLDGGDWGEGTSFFHANQGVDSIRALSMLGVDVATIGNHDHMLGGNKLGRQIRAANVNTKFVLANIKTTPEMELDGVVTPYIDMNTAGIPIRVIGLTTAQAFFQYTISPGKFYLPNAVGEAQGRLAKKSGRELVIALTHIGLDQDKSLARNSTSIDLIVGGHTHTRLDDIQYQKNRNGKQIPIVQAWAHGLAVGSLLLDVEEGGKMTVVEYKLHKIDETVVPDAEVENFVRSSIQRRNQSFPFNWYETIGESDTPLSGYVLGHAVYKKSCWAWHMATAAREAAGASVGVHIASFEGVYKPAGPITLGDISDQFPHFRRFGDQGWEIATIRISGWKLRPLMWIINRLNVGVTFSGLGYKKDLPLIEDKAIYTLAFPAEIAYAINTSQPRYAHFLKGLKFTGKHYWPVVSDYVKRNTPISCR